MPGIPAIKAGFCYEFTLKVEGSVIRLSEPIVTPWETGTINGGDATELQLDAYYVKEHATGNATGMDWDNAMGVDGLRNLLRTNTTVRSRLRMLRNWMVRISMWQAVPI